MNQIELDELRSAMGTLPSNNFLINYSIKKEDLLETNIIDINKNPFRSIFSTATATWGDNEYKDKWLTTNHKHKLMVIVAALSGRTLPQALENVNITWRIKGTPRSTFNRHTEKAKLGCTFYSIGCRDNNKLDTDFIIPNNYSNEEIQELNLENYFKNSKTIYSEILKDDMGSWQSARAFLPLCYQHSYHFTQNLLSFLRMYSAMMNDKLLKCLYEKLLQNILNEGFSLFYSAIIDNKKFKETNIENITLTDFEKQLLKDK